MKRFITVLMSAMIALSMMPTMAFAATSTNCAGGESCDHVASITEGDVTTHYDTLKEAVEGATDGDTINLLQSSTFGSAICIDKEITIKGSPDITLTASFKDGKNRAIEIDTNKRVVLDTVNLDASTTDKRGIELVNSESNLVLKNCYLVVGQRGITCSGDAYNGVHIEIDHTTIRDSGVPENDIETKVIHNQYHRGISLWNMTNSSVTLKNSEINGFGYAINVSGDKSESGVANTKGLKVTIEDSTIRSWAALNVWGSEAEYSINRSKILGINVSNGSSDNFAALVFNDDIYDTFANAHAENNILSIKDSTITNYQGGSCTENLLRIDCGITRLNLEGTVQFIDTTGNVYAALYVPYMNDPVEFINNRISKDGANIVCTRLPGGEDFLFAPEYDTYYYWSDGNGGYDGVYCSLSEVFLGENLVLCNGEYIDLIADAILDGNKTASLDEGAGVFYINFGNYNVTGGKIILPAGVTAICDKAKDDLFSAPDGYVLIKESNAGKVEYRPCAVSDINSEVNNSGNIDAVLIVNDISVGDTININKDITVEGEGNTITATEGVAKKHLLLITSGATIKNVTLDSNKQAKGVQVYSNNTLVEASFDNVSFKNSAGSGLTVNGTIVNLKDAVFDGNAWQDVNVDSGVGVTNDSVLNISTGCTFNNQYQITSDGQKVGGKYTDKYGIVNLNDSSKILDVKDVKVGEGDSEYTKRFWTVSDKPAPAPIPEPEDPITNTGSGDNASTNVDASDNTTTSDSGKTETTIDSALGDKIVENAKDNNVADVVIKAETEKGDSTGSTVALPEATVQALAKDTEASVTIKTDSAEVSLDKAAVDAVAAQAGTDGEVKLVVETVENTEDTLKVELKLVTSKGTVTDFQGGNVTVTVPVSEELAGKKLVCVYIDDNGKYIMMDGALAADGKTFTFTTGHFSTYAILSEEEAKAAIDGQDISKASVSGIANKTYTGKAVTQKLTVKAGDKGLVEGTDYTVSYSKNVNVGVASVKITGKGKYEGSLTKTFKINPKGTSISKVSGHKKAVKVVWKKQLTKMKSSYVSGYQVQYSTSSKFTSGTSKYTNAKFSKGRTTKTIKNLKAGKKYYVRVRTYKTVDGTKCYSSWSKAKSVKTK